MCSITTPRAAPQAPIKPLVQVRKVTPLQTYLNDSYKRVRAAGKLGADFGLKTHIPISIYLRSTGTDHIYAGNSVEINGTLHQLDLEECFSGSLIKMAAMFAAYTLRREADVLRIDMKEGVVDVPLAKFFDKLAERVNPSNDALPEITTAAKDPKNNIPMAPSLRDILSITSLTTPVTFTDDFRAHLRSMIIPSDDCDAAECIFRLSYPYINVKLMQEGYFHRDRRKGIWLCGDYFDKDLCLTRTDLKTRGQAFIRIDTINDCDQTKHPPFCGSAQNTTSKEMARLFLNILLKALVDPTSSDEMRSILHEAEHGSPDDTPAPAWPAPAPDRSFLRTKATGSVARKFRIDGVKIGQGPIKEDHDRGTIEVRSEGLLIIWKGVADDDPHPDPALRKKFDDLKLTGEAAICWQNLPNNIDSDGIIQIINDTISGFIDQAAVTP
jgi:hypothetical protein